MRIIGYFVSLVTALLFMLFISGRPLIQEMLDARSINRGDFLIDGSLIIIVVLTIAFANSRK